jgi:hypothetical protein
MLEELSGPVTAWLKERGFKPYINQVPPISGDPVDAVGTRDGMVAVVETEGNLSDVLILRAWNHQLFAHECWACVCEEPPKKRLEICRGKGVGVLSLRDGELVVLLEPKKAAEWPMRHYVDRMIGSLKDKGAKPKTPGEVWKANFIQALILGKRGGPVETPAEDED